MHLPRNASAEARHVTIHNISREADYKGPYFQYRIVHEAMNQEQEWHHVWQVHFQFSW